MPVSYPPFDVEITARSTAITQAGLDAVKDGVRSEWMSSPAGSKSPEFTVPPTKPEVRTLVEGQLRKTFGQGAKLVVLTPADYT